MARQDVDIVPPQYVGAPPLISGDADFWGPPNFLARFWLRNLNQIIYLRGRLRWEEPKPDFTTFQLEMNRALFDIRSQLGGDWYFVQFREMYDLDIPAQQIPGIDRGLQQVYNANQGIIASISAEGDSYAAGSEGLTIQE
jgi:hypothetical protein